MSASAAPAFPFTAIVGQDTMRLGLVLCALDPHIGGVLLRGERGSAKSTAVRAFAGLLPEIDVTAGCPYRCLPGRCSHSGDAVERCRVRLVDLPLGATEDRLVGTIDVGAALGGKGVRFSPGLVAEANRGVLYVDEVNLLPDHLVDVLLDVAASGVNRVEREGVSAVHPAEFLLVGSMNPEEGELRPQFLDRFGLAVDVVTPRDPEERAEIVRRRVAFDADPDRFRGRWAQEEAALAQRITSARERLPRVDVPDDAVVLASRICAEAGAEGSRADLVTYRSARALAAWDAHAAVGEDDVRRAAALALAHRVEDPPAPPPPGGAPPPPPPDGDQGPGPGPAPEDRTDRPAPGVTVGGLGAPRLPRAAPDPLPGRRSPGPGARGRLVADRTTDAAGPAGDVGGGARARAVAASGAARPGPEHVRTAVRERRHARLVVFCVDASGSMGARERMSLAKGAVLDLLGDVYVKRDRVALVTFRGDGAEVVLPPTSGIDVAGARLADLPTGGRTPLAAGLRAALKVALAQRDTRTAPLLVVLTDGRPTAGVDPWAEALAAAAEIRRHGVHGVFCALPADDPAPLDALARTAGAEVRPVHGTGGILSALPGASG